MSKPTRVQILGKRWTLRFTPTSDEFGHCDPPDKPGKEIVVDSRLTGEQRLDVILHECLHAADWRADEDYIEEQARDLARVLWRLGYRCRGEIGLSDK